MTMNSGKPILMRVFTGLALAGGICFSTASAESMSTPLPAGQEYEAHAKECRSNRSGKHALKVVKSFYENLGKGDLPAIMGTFAQDAQWVLHAPAGTAIPYRGYA